jgi:hypothetical protein
MSNNTKKQVQKLTEMGLLSAVENVSKLLITDREIETSLQPALDYLIDELAVADAGIVWGYEPSTDRLIAEVASGVDINKLKQVRLNTSEKIIGRVLQTGKSELYAPGKAISDTEDNTKKIFGAKIPGLDFSAAVACIPLSTEATKIWRFDVRELRAWRHIYAK